MLKVRPKTAIRACRQLSNTGRLLKARRRPQKDSLRPLKAQKTRRKEVPEPIYYDPENRSLDLSLANDKLFKNIEKEASERTRLRFHDPSRKWFKDHANDVKDRLDKCIRNATVSAKNAQKDVAVGDVVSLKPDSVELHIIVALPQALGLNIYTFVNSQGEISQMSKAAIRCRFPAVVPPSLVGVVQKLVAHEQKYLDVPPVGVPDARFSRSVEALPMELRGSTKAVNSSEVGAEDPGDTEADFVVTNALSQLLTNLDVNTFHVPLSGRKLYAQALTDVSIAAFGDLPEVTEKLFLLHRVLQYTEHGDLVDLPRTVSIFDILSFLEHLVLGKNGEWTEERFKEARKQLADGKSADFRKKSAQNSPILGKAFPKGIKFDEKEFPVSRFLAVVLALRKQARIWSLGCHGQRGLPLAVTILPLSRLRALEETVTHLKAQNGDLKFAHFMVERARGRSPPLPEFCDEIRTLLRDYVVGDVAGDPVLETALVSVIRLADAELKKAGILPSSVVPHSHEHSRARAYELLQIVGDERSAPEIDAKDPKRDKKAKDAPKMAHLPNPAKWLHEALLPGSTVLPFAEMSETYFRVLDRAGPETLLGSKPSNESDTSDAASALTNDFYVTDPYGSARIDFGEVPVYCIDSETAHEIDDGVSIHQEGADYVISVHIANPTSYIRPFSVLSAIAYDRGTTAYFPEGPIMMLPLVISLVAGLGGKEPTRTFGVQYRLEKKLVDAYIRESNASGSLKPSKEASGAFWAQMEATARVGLFTVRNFPPGYTYTKVNDVLGSSENKKRFESGSLEGHERNLFLLHRIAGVLRDARITEGKGLEFGTTQLLVSVEMGPVDRTPFSRVENGYRVVLPEGPAILVVTNSAQNELSASQLLVSQLMVSANHCAAVFAAKKGISVIHRAQEMALEPHVLSQIQKLTSESYQSGKGLEVEAKSHVLGVLSRALFLVAQKRHQLLGVTSYATVTSPLRRYVDMVNHWKFEERLFGASEAIKDDQLASVGAHLQARETATRYTSRFASKFWEGEFLRQYALLLQNGEGLQPIEFELLVKSDVKFGDVSVDVLNFNNIRGRLASNTALSEGFENGEVKIGLIMRGPFPIVRLDLVEDELVFEYERPKEGEATTS